MKSCAVWPPRDCFYAHGIAPDATYRFKHALIRDAAMKRCSGHGTSKVPMDKRTAAKVVAAVHLSHLTEKSIDLAMPVIDKRFTDLSFLWNLIQACSF
jgi:hypothetical protein